MKNPIPCFVTVAARSYTRMTTTVADAEPEDLTTIKRKPWLLGVTSQKEQLGTILMLVIHITVLLYLYHDISISIQTLKTQALQFEEKRGRLQLKYC